MGHETVLCEIRDGIATVTLNRPDKLNAINEQMLGELDTVFSRLEPDLDAKVIVVKGAGRCFSVGDDLSQDQRSTNSLRKTSRSSGTMQLMQSERGASRRWEYMFNVAKPTIAQVHGYCLGTGLHLAMVCDLVVAGEDAVLGDPSVHFEALPAIPLLPWLVGMKRAVELSLTGKSITGGEAEDMGLINKAVPADQLERVVRRWAEGIGLINSDALAAAKDSINGVMDVRGLGAAYRFGSEMSSFMELASQNKDITGFYRTRDKSGLRAALQEKRNALGESDWVLPRKEL